MSIANPLSTAEVVDALCPLVHMLIAKKISMNEPEPAKTCVLYIRNIVSLYCLKNIVLKTNSLYSWHVSINNYLNCMTTTASAHNSHPSPKTTTESQWDSSWTDFFDPVSHPMGQDHPAERSMGNNL